MDLFTGAVGTGQVHDFNPGTDNGLFWTVCVPGDAVSADIAHGTASLALDDFDVEDYHNLLNALQDGPSDEASVSFQMSWTAAEAPMNVTDPVHHFDGRFTLCDVQIEWSATAPNFTFKSDPASTTTNVRSVIGHERNGVFFSE
ncbi:MAG TPA: hypothetical protein VHO95_03475 [Candidatus Dormibacteraeota bacterium]|jgi:hypothetical protein|nr:hypothetical protein [Candidatus Dormibacteraeota bacterium]